METSSFKQEAEIYVKKQQEAVQRILEVSTELHLTWKELDDAIDSIKRTAYISSGKEPVSTS